MGPVSGAGSEGRANMVRVSCAGELNPIQYYLRELSAGELRETQLQLSYRAPESTLGVTVLVARPRGSTGAERGFSTSLAIYFGDGYAQAFNQAAYRRSQMGMASSSVSKGRPGEVERG